MLCLTLAINYINCCVFHIIYIFMDDRGVRKMDDCNFEIKSACRFTYNVDVSNRFIINKKSFNLISGLLRDGVEL